MTQEFFAREIGVQFLKLRPMSTHDLHIWKLRSSCRRDCMYQVFFPKKAHWLHDYRSELTSFPGAKHDDQVDSTSQALTHLKNSNSSLATWEKLGRRAQ
jgi:hypothetical protein